jgi:lysine 6-dehydrogenase
LKVGVIGSGLMGSVIGWDMARSKGVDEVVVADVDEERLNALKRRTGGRRLSVERLDVSDRSATVRFLKRFDVACSALPHGFVHLSDLAAVKAGAKMVNIAFEDEQVGLDQAARKTGAALVPGCGLAPGLGGILLAHGAATLRDVYEGHILVGGLPQKPIAPYNYRLVFSIVGLLREYIDEARVVRDGRVVRVRPFDTVERVRFPAPTGELEAFCTDGLASLLYTMKGMKVLDEKTLRYPGHAEKMKLLMDSGFFSREKTRVGEDMVTPLEMSWAVLSRKLSEGDSRDVTVMRVIAKGRSDTLSFDMVDKYDEEAEVTSMGKTTGFTASIVAQMLGSGAIRRKGVVPPETAVTGVGVETLLRELRNRGVSLATRRSRASA